MNTNAKKFKKIDSLLNQAQGDQTYVYIESNDQKYTKELCRIELIKSHKLR